MSLLEEAFEPLQHINKITVDDGYGGTKTEWRPGATFSGAIVLETSTGAKIAQALGVKSVYTVTVRKDIQLDFHDVIMRVSDGKIFRITNDSDDRKTPASAALNMRQYDAEAWELPT